MEYRTHQKTGDKISILGLGTGPILETPKTEGMKLVLCEKKRRMSLTKKA